MAMALAVGCVQADPVEILDVSAQHSDTIRTVVTVEWETQPAAISYVEYGLDEGLGRVTAIGNEPATSHRAVLLGLPPETDVWYRVVAEYGGQEVTGELEMSRTGALPQQLPSLTASGEGMGQAMLVTLLGSTTAPVIIDSLGRIVWYWLDDSGLDVYRARLSVDGQSVVYNAASVSGDPSDESQLVRVALDGSWVEAIDVPLLAHDFVELPDGTLGALVVEYREFDGAPLRGDQIVEIGTNGETTVVWSAWDCFDPALTEHGEMDHGWTFANALDYDAAAGAYTVGLRNFSSIVQVDRASGECLWGLGGQAATLDVTDGTPFLHQHQFHLLGDSLLVFDNDGSGAGDSRVVEYALDLDAGEAEQIWSFSTDPSVFVFVLGDAHRFDDGDTLVTWSVAGQIERVDPSGSVRWSLNTDVGYAFGFNTVIEGL